MATLPAPSDPAVAELGVLTPGPLWSAADRLVAAHAAMHEVRVSLGGLEMEDVGSAPALVADIESAHAAVDEAERAAEAVRIPAMGATVLGAVAGLLGVAVSPSYAADSLVYLYVSTPEDNRIVRATLDGGALGEPEVVLDGIPNGFIHDGGTMRRRTGRRSLHSHHGNTMSTMRTVKVDGEARYDICIGPGLLGDSALLAHVLRGRQPVQRHRDLPERHLYRRHGAQLQRLERLYHRQLLAEPRLPARGGGQRDRVRRR